MTADPVPQDTPAPVPSPETQPPPPTQTDPALLGRGLVGAVVGVIAGYAIFYALAHMGLYAPIIPGAVVGVGCSMVARQTSQAIGILCGVLGLALSVYIEADITTFASGGHGLKYFLTHPQEWGGFTTLMIVLNGVLAYWFGRGPAGCGCSRC